MQTFLLPCLLAAVAAPTFVSAESNVLELEYPAPKVTSTPAPIRLPHLETPNTPAPEIIVPDGVINLAAGKTVTSSDPWPIIGELDMVTDGDKESEDGYYVELGEMQQWVQIDLEQTAEIYGIGLWQYHAQPRSYLDVIVQVSQDADFSSEVTTLFNNDHDNSSDMGRGSDPAYIEKNRGRLIPGNNAVGRYLRIYSNGNTSDGLNHFIEIEVFGLPEASPHAFSTGVIDYGVVVSNIEKSVAFYESIGLQQLTAFSLPGQLSGDAGLTDFKDLEVVMMTATGGENDSKVKLIQLPGNPQNQDQTFIDSTYGLSYQTFFVEDMDATSAMLAANGIKVLANGPTDLTSAGFEGIHILLIRDPDGNFVEFVGPR